MSYTYHVETEIGVTRLCPRHRGPDGQSPVLKRGTRRCVLGKKRGVSQCVPPTGVEWKDRVCHDDGVTSKRRRRLLLRMFRESEMVGLCDLPELSTVE